MPRQIIHNATVTLKLPADISPNAEFSALRAAGIPVDALGNVESGYLFVRYPRDLGRPNIFRWFARGLG
jgi:hypothetical protein